MLPAVPPRRGVTRSKEPAMPRHSKDTVAVLGIDIGKNTFHLVGLNKRGAIILRQKLSRTIPLATHRRSIHGVMDGRRRGPVARLPRARSTPQVRTRPGAPSSFRLCAISRPTCPSNVWCYVTVRIGDRPC